MILQGGLPSSVYVREQPFTIKAHGLLLWTFHYQERIRNQEFHDSAMDGSVERMKRVFEQGGIDVNSTEPLSGSTAAHAAARMGHANIIEYLASMEGGKVNFNAVDANGNTPLHHAASFGHSAIVTVLLLAGADKSIKNKEGKLPSELAPDNGFFWYCLY